MGRGAGLALLLAGLALAPLADAGPRERVIVQFHREPTAAERAALAAHGVREFVSVIPAGIGEAGPRDLAWLRAQPVVERIDRDEPLEPHLDMSTRLIRAGEPALSLGFDGSGVTVAVLDSGVDTTHPDLEGRVLANMVWLEGTWQPSPGDVDGHGTHVAGVAAGSGAASGGALRGVAPGAGLVGLDFSRSFTTSTALRAFDWVHENAARLNIRVVTNSWGRAEETRAWDPGDSLVRASDALVREGLVVLFSAGNRGPGAGTISLEAQNPNVVTVGAVDDAALLAGFSGRGPVLLAGGERAPWVKPDLVAGGVGILSARSSQATGPIRQPVLEPSQLPGLGQGLGEEAVRYVELSGTSQAAPHVAGVVALMLQANPSLSPAQVHDLLRDSAIDLREPGPDDASGWGLVDARDAVRRALGLAEDWGNILLAGGEESYAAQGSLAGAAGQLVQTSPVLQVKEQGVVEAAFPVKVGATSARFDFAWSPATASFRVYVVGPTRTLGPWSTSRPEGGERVVSGLIEDPEPGVHRLVARPLAPVDAHYRAFVTVAVGERAALPAELEERYRAPGDVGPWEEIANEIDAEIATIRRFVPGPEPALVIAGLAAAALAARRRR